MNAATQSDTFFHAPASEPRRQTESPLRRDDQPDTDSPNRPSRPDSRNHYIKQILTLVTFAPGILFLLVRITPDYPSPQSVYGKLS